MIISLSSDFNFLTTFSGIDLLCLRDEESRGIFIYPCPSVRPSIRSSFCPFVLPSVRPSIRSSVCPSGDRYMVCSTIFSYSFGATALIFCKMFKHIMKVCMSTGFWFSSNSLKMTGSWTSFPSDGQAGASFVSYRHTSFFLNHS